MALQQCLSDDLDAQLTIIRTKAERLWASQRHRYFTDHQIDHSERIIRILDAVTAELMGSDRRLDTQEIFVLLASAYLHDIGMQWEKGKYRDDELARKDHHLLSYEMIVGSVEDPGHYPVLGVERDYVYEIALVSKGHRQVDLYDSEYNDGVKRGEKIRLRLLAALLRLADELDIDERRVYIDLLKVADVPRDSRVHWWKCHYVSGVDIGTNGQITIQYHVPRQEYIEPLVRLVETDLRDKFEDLQDILWDNLVRLRIRESRAIQGPGKEEMSDEDFSYMLERARGEAADPVSSEPYTGKRRHIHERELKEREGEPARAQEPRTKEGHYISEPDPGELEAELRHALEIRKEKRRYVRALELDEAHKGASFPLERRVELERLREEMVRLDGTIDRLEAMCRHARLASIPLPYPTGPSGGLIVNPGFEEGFIGWREDPPQFQYDSQSEEDSTEVHSGQRSRKLFLCWGGSHIIQNINLSTPLPIDTQITLRAWVKMPYPGSQDNKWFSLELVTVGTDGQKDSRPVDQYSVLPVWSQLSTGPLVAKFPVTQLGIHAMTSKGNGSHKGLDRPVWVDDFELDILPAIKNAATKTMLNPAAVDPTKLRQAMHSAYDHPAFEILCKDLGLDYDDLRGETLELKMLYLIDWYQRHRRYPDLVRKVVEDHPYLAQELQE